MINLIEEAQRKASLMEKEKPWVRLSVIERAMLYTVQEEFERIGSELGRIGSELDGVGSELDRIADRLGKLEAKVDAALAAVSGEA